MAIKKILHSCHAMCKILEWSFHQNEDGSNLKFPPNLIYNWKIIIELSPKPYHWGQSTWDISVQPRKVMGGPLLTER